MIVPMAVAMIVAMTIVRVVVLMVIAAAAGVAMRVVVMTRSTISVVMPMLVMIMSVRRNVLRIGAAFRIERGLDPRHVRA